MAKLTKKALKNLVKECLIEILAEGLSSETLNERVTSRKKKPSPEREFLSKKRSLGNDSFNETADKHAKNMTSDPVMQSIFADTAKTTLQEQLKAGKMPSAPAGSDRAAQIVSQAKPEELFGGSSNWAAMAFSESTPKPAGD